MQRVNVQLLNGCCETKTEIKILGRIQNRKINFLKLRFFTGKITGFVFKLRAVRWGLLGKFVFAFFPDLLKIWYSVDEKFDLGRAKKWF